MKLNVIFSWFLLHFTATNCLPISSNSGNYVVPSYPNQQRRISNRVEVNYQRRTDDDFISRGSRLGFVRKVYSIFLAQMAATVAVTGSIMTNKDLAYFLMRNYKPIMLTSTVSSSGILIALVGNANLRHKYPLNILILSVYTIISSIFVGVFSLFFDPKLICLGTVHTLAAFGAITLWTFQPSPKLDLTVRSSVFLTAAVSLVTGSLLSIFFKMPWLDNLISAGLAILFAGYIAYDTQMIIGGKHHKYSYGKDEYILAALNLYQDVINLFMRIVILLSKNKSNKEGSQDADFQL